MKGWIGFYHHRITCIIGVLPHERTQEQVIIISLKVKTDFSACALSDSVEDTINYVELADRCTALARNGKYQLLETLACHILDDIFKEFKLEAAWIEIRKPAAIPSADCTVVELERSSAKEQ